MDIEKALTDKLLGIADLTAIVGQNIWASDDLPEPDLLPALCFWCMNDDIQTTMTGPNGLERPIYQFHYYSRVKNDVRKIRQALIDNVIGFQGAQGDIFIDSILPYGGGGRAIPFSQTPKLFGWETELVVSYYQVSP